MAPILSFTAEEAWKQAGGSETVFVGQWHALPQPKDAEALIERWTALRAVRADVQKELEAVREKGGIGSPLQANVLLRLKGERHRAAAGLGDDLKFVLVTSGATVEEAAAEAEEKIEVVPSPDTKCERCWHWRADVGSDPVHPGLCGRCLSNLFGAGERRQAA
jgi:isoleucyl-tRNA synthetase